MELTRNRRKNSVAASTLKLHRKPHSDFHRKQPSNLHRKPPSSLPRNELSNWRSPDAKCQADIVVDEHLQVLRQVLAKEPQKERSLHRKRRLWAKTQFAYWKEFAVKICQNLWKYLQSNHTVLENRRVSGWIWFKFGFRNPKLGLML